jgi:hypothetical protein
LHEDAALQLNQKIALIFHGLKKEDNENTTIKSTKTIFWTRVTRWGDVSPIGSSFEHFAQFFENFLSGPQFWATFSYDVIILTKMDWATF